MFTTGVSFDYVLAKEYLKKLNQKAILETILKKPVDLQQNVLAPHRSDRKAGCKYSYKEGLLLLFDASRGKTYDVISLISACFEISFQEAYQKIITLPEILTDVQFTEIDAYHEIKEFELYYQSRNITKEDINFWSTNHIKVTEENIQKFGIVPLKGYNLNKRNYKPPGLAYLFVMESNWQLYRPDFEKDAYGYEGRYRAKSMLGLHGTSFLCQTNKEVLITKSFSDWFYLQVCNINSLFVLKEGHNYTKEELAFLKNYQVTLLYDNDLTGIINSMEKKQKHKFEHRFLPQKDTKDFLKVNSVKKLQKLLKQWQKIN